RLAAIGRRRHDAQRSTADPRTAAFIAAHRAPAAAATGLPTWSAPERRRPGAADQQHTRSFTERIIQRDGEVGMDHDLLGHVTLRERLPERLTLRLARRTGDADAEHLRHHVRHL